MNELPDRLPRKYIIKAIRAYDDGFPHLFKEARRYEVVFDGRRYPSKAIVGIAATLMTGKTFTPQDFSGAIKSKCVRLLIEQGFHIVQGEKGAATVSDTLFPDELTSQIDYVEGAATQVVVNRYERDRNARQKALEYHGYQCKVCGLDMSKVYGEIGKGFIHIHHLVPLSAIKEDYHLDPIDDLIPVCPNCHAMLHRHNPPLTPEELKQRMS